jgi:hypothetical protein
MRTDLDFGTKNLFGPVVFRPDFNQFATVGSDQAWSLLFSAGKEDKAFADNRELGLYLNYILGTLVVAGALGSIFFGTTFPAGV